MTDPSETVQASVARINDQDVAGLLALMTPDHRLIDPGGEVVTGVENVQRAWDGYFRMVPDYCVRVGALVRAYRVVTWQVYADNEPMRSVMGRE